jgi:ATP-dependent DNA helicase RecG
VLLIGVENDGIVTGAKPRHGRTTDPIKVQAAVFNNTVPSVNTRVSVVAHPAGDVLAIEVDPYPEPCATASGKCLRRTIGPDGKPQSVPFYPRDQRSRRADLGLLDFSAQAM